MHTNLEQINIWIERHSLSTTSEFFDSFINIWHLESLISLIFRPTSSSPPIKKPIRTPIFFEEMDPKSKKKPMPSKVHKSLSYVRGFKELYCEALESQAHTNTLFQQVDLCASGLNKFSVLLFFSEAKA